MAARLAEADGPDAVRAIFEDARAQTYKVRAQTYKVVVGLGSEDQMDAVSEVAAPSPAPSPDDPLDALARALTERLAAMQQQELRALKAEVSAALSL